MQDNLHPTSHVIIEAHPDVLAHMRATGWYDKPGVVILEGKWQDFMEDEVLLSEGFDIMYTDTFSEHYNGPYLCVTLCLPCSANKPHS